MGFSVMARQFSSHPSPSEELCDVLSLTDQSAFARNRIWSLDPNPSPLYTNSNQAIVDLLLKPVHEDLRIWPHRFEFRLRVALGLQGELNLITRIRNVDSRPFSFVMALQAHFSVSDISDLRIEGLETLQYLDNLQDGQLFTEQAEATTLESETYKIYLKAPTKIIICDHQKRREFLVKKAGLREAAIWNPWDKQSKAMVDFGNDEYQRMVCVMACAIAESIKISPGEEWRGQLQVTPISLASSDGGLGETTAVAENSRSSCRIN